MGGIGDDMQFMARALGLLPQPAALFEMPGHRFLAANPPAKALAFTYAKAVDLEDPEMVAKVLDLADPLSEAEYMDEGVLTYEADYGLVHVSRIPSQSRHPRPDLLLVTMHQSSRADAWLDHNRMILALKVNESSEISMRVLESSLTQIGAALQAQAELVHAYNSRMEDWMVRREVLPPSEKKFPARY